MILDFPGVYIGTGKAEDVLLARFIINLAAKFDHLFLLGERENLVDQDVENDVYLHEVFGMFDVAIAGIVENLVFQDELYLRHREIENLGVDVDEVFLFVEVVAPAGDPRQLIDLDKFGYFQEIQTQTVACLD